MPVQRRELLRAGARAALLGAFGGLVACGRPLASDEAPVVEGAPDLGGRAPVQAVEPARWAYGLLTYALLVDVMYRSLARHEAAWDLMALVIVGGAVCTVYQARHKILGHGWVMKAALAACVAGVLAAVLAVTLA